MTRPRTTTPGTSLPGDLDALRYFKETVTDNSASKIVAIKIDFLRAIFNRETWV
jgi:hypothetical protein